MIYIKVYKEHLEFKDEIQNLRLKYKSKLDDCLLYLSDNYELKYNESDTLKFTYSFKINKDKDKVDVIDSLRRSVEKIQYELNGVVLIVIRRYKKGQFSCINYVYTTILDFEKELLSNRFRLEDSVEERHLYIILEIE